MSLFRSFIQGGFECATHKNIHKQRIDVVASSGHDEFVRQDYARMADADIATVREGARWHVIEAQPGVYDFSSLETVYRAAEETDTEVILDLMHFGWPDFLDVYSAEFINSFANFARAMAGFLQKQKLERHFVIPINEISFLAWAGGDTGGINPHSAGRGVELKRQLVKAAIAASELLLQELPSVCLVSAEPVIHIFGGMEAERHRLAMYEAWDMLTGRSCAELGGRAELLHVIGVNYYDRNQWIHNGDVIRRHDPRYRPFSKILHEIALRYQLPLLISETGTEGADRAEWFGYIASEARTAMRQGVPVEGICLYPILNHPGWDDDRHCHNGLFDYPDENGHREMYQPLGQAIARERVLLQRLLDLPLSA